MLRLARNVCASAVEQMALQARQVLAACEKTPTDEVPVNYDPRNPFDICCVTFTPIYRYAAAATHVGLWAADGCAYHRSVAVMRSSWSHAASVKSGILHSSC
eukprot:GHRQ01021880.1.p2 GENE.GHRQ01021880.1~~GHRQ01021880.1.p2  ORF type:complete len:102 (-),score=16.38 GHRQ01021880.1:481-786(-)